MATTVTYKVVDYLDIAHSKDGNTGGSSPIWLPDGATIHYTGIAIPKGATIVSAKITGYAQYPSSDLVTVKVSGYDTDNAPRITTSNIATVNANKTTAYVDWATPVWTGGQAIETPDIKAIIQEIVDRPGWASGNAMVLILDAGTYSGMKNINGTYDGAPADQIATYPPQLTVTYTEAPAPTTKTFAIATGADDGRAWSTDSSFDNTFYYTASADYSSVFFRFSGISIPKNATITSAKLEFDAYYDTNSAQLTIKASNVDNAPRPTTAANVFAVDNTLATTWDTTPWSTPKQHVISPDIKTLVQALVNRSGWASGNAMLFVISGQAAGKYFFMYEATAWDGGTDHCPKLTVTYTEGAAPADPNGNAAAAPLTMTMTIKAATASGVRNASSAAAPLTMAMNTPAPVAAGTVGAPAIRVGIIANGYRISW